MASDKLTIATLWLVVEAGGEGDFDARTELFMMKADALAAALKRGLKTGRSLSVITLQQAIETKVADAVYDRGVD